MFLPVSTGTKMIRIGPLSPKGKEHASPAQRTRQGSTNGPRRTTSCSSEGVLRWEVASDFRRGSVHCFQRAQTPIGQKGPRLLHAPWQQKARPCRPLHMRHSTKGSGDNSPKLLSLIAKETLSIALKVPSAGHPHHSFLGLAQQEGVYWACCLRGCCEIRWP